MAEKNKKEAVWVGGEAAHALMGMDVSMKRKLRDSKRQVEALEKMEVHLNNLCEILTKLTAAAEHANEVCQRIEKRV